MPFHLIPRAAATRACRFLVKPSAGSAMAATCRLSAVFLLACASGKGAQDSTTATIRTSTMQAAQESNKLTDAERRDGWRLLFDGTSLDGWRQYQADSVPTAWRVIDGAIAKNVGTRDIITRDQFGDFELSFDWKVATGGNAGVFYRATEEYERVYWSAPEYQLLDDPNAGAEGSGDRLRAAGSAYGLYSSPSGILKAANEWNTARIVALGGHIEHWLNGTKLLEYEAWSPEWEAKVKASKFNDWPNYGRAKRGHIGLQGDHRGDLALRNIRIRELR